MVKLGRKLLCLLALAGCVGWLPMAAAEEVSVRVEPNPPPANESFSLIFEIEGAVDDEPDFKPLERDFRVLGRNQQTSIRLLNGHQRRSTMWTLSVLPKHGPPLVVPSIAFGTLKTAPLPLTFASGAASAPPDDGLLLESEATPTQPYVQQEVLYTVRLWRRYEISNASLSEPAFSGDVVVKPLEEERRSEQQRNGQRYEVVEKRFVVYPQKSGPLTIKPAEVTAQVVKRNFSLFDNFSQAMATRRVVSNPVSLEVRPVPAGFPQGKPWLPARALSLQDDWVPDLRRAKLGEPVTRTLTLWADGLTAGQLPPLVVEPPAGWKGYPERPQTNDQQQDGGFHGVLAQKLALIPQRAGSAEVPALEIPWWNTTTDSLAMARVAPVTLEAEAVPGQPAPPEASAPTPVPPAQTSAVPSAQPPPGPAPSEAGLGASTWRWLAALAVLGWLLTAFLYWHRAPAAASPAAGGAIGARPARHGEALALACRNNDLLAIERALLAWAHDEWPATPPRTLGALAKRVHAALGVELEKLDAARHARQSDALDPGLLLRAWQAQRTARSERKTVEGGVLPKLYPHMVD